MRFDKNAVIITTGTIITAVGIAVAATTSEGVGIGIAILGALIAADQIRKWYNTLPHCSICDQVIDPDTFKCGNCHWQN